jgi:hypothetical protein
MRRTLILLTPLLLAGCIKQSASYYIDGNDHALTVRAEQEYFWKDEVTLTLVASRMPDCQRQFPLAKERAADAVVELFASGDNVFTVRTGALVWQVDTQGCTKRGPPAPDGYGSPVGVFRLENKNMVFEPVAAEPAPAAG